LSSTADRGVLTGEITLQFQIADPLEKLPHDLHERHPLFDSFCGRNFPSGPVNMPQIPDVLLTTGKLALASSVVMTPL
jgi:hypothetical protein